MKLNIRGIAGLLSTIAIILTITAVINRNIDYAIEHGETLHGGITATEEELEQIPHYRNFAFLMIFSIVIYGCTAYYFVVMKDAYKELYNKRNKKFIFLIIFNITLLIIFASFAAYEYINQMIYSFNTVKIILLASTLFVVLQMSIFGHFSRIMKYIIFTDE